MTVIDALDVSSEEYRRHFLHVLVTDHSKALLGYAERLLNDHQMAEDVVQEALIRAWNHAEKLRRSEGSIRGWLLTVVRNLAVDRLRSAAYRHETVGVENHDVSQRDHVDAVLARIEATRLLRFLSIEHREVLMHTYLCGRTLQETAKILGIPAGTVKSRQHYALNNLRSRPTGRPGRRPLRSPNHSQMTNG